MSARAVALFALLGFLFMSLGAHGQEERSNFVQFVETTDEVDDLLRDQGPAVLFENAWYKLAREEHKGVVIYYLYGLPDKKKAESVFLTFGTQYTTDACDRPMIPRLTEAGSRNWSYEGWRAMYQWFAQVKLPEIDFGKAIYFCKDEAGIRRRVLSAFKNYPRGYSVESLRLIFRAVDRELQANNKAVLAALDQIMTNEFLAKRIAESSTFTETLLSNEAFMSALKRKLLEP